MGAGMHKEVIGNTPFTFRKVEPPESFDALYRLRYQVYCNECGFIRPEDFPSGKESDKYDPYSVHFIAEDHIGPIGTARVILDSPHGFPLEEHCKGALTSDLSGFPRKNLAEVSRLVISKEYRKRMDDGIHHSPASQYAPQPAGAAGAKARFQRIRSMAFGLYREMYQDCKRRGITHWYAVMEEPLRKLLRSSGFVFHPIGNTVDFYGPVKPYLTALEEMERTVFAEFPGFYNNYFMDGLEPEFRPKL
jgi:N-acyl amino acid synthase of PEP-CTERM/exosortase system